MVRWRRSRRSTNIEDRRGRRAGGIAIGGGSGLLILLVLMLCFGGDPAQLLDVATQIEQQPPVTPETVGTPDDETGEFLSAILGSTEDVWAEIFASRGAQYQPPTLVLFTDIVRSACGTTSSATGPFYCPLDQKVYLDTGFFRELARMGGAGDFAVAYVVGHEVGHHVQNLVGTSRRVRERQQRGGRAEANALSVRMELQADCYAGVWANHANRRQQILEPGDVEEGLAAAAAIGDDRLMRRSGRAVSPESFTHGTSEQRQRWLRAGLESGDIDRCDTFS